MKFKCGPTRREKFATKERWHDWFAWRPVRLETKQCVWLEPIQRKGDFHCWGADSRWTFEYRLKEIP